MSEEIILEAVGVTKRFGGLTAVDEVSFSIKPRTIKALIGPNGAGKSTMLNMLSGVYRPTSGTIRMKGKRIDNRKPYQIAALGVGRTFQTVHLFGNMTVVENVMVGLHMKSRGGILNSALRLPPVPRDEKIVFERAMGLLAKVGLESRALEIATNLPYGQQRMLETARAMASEPALLLLDEPAAGLSSKEAEEFATLIQMIKESGVAVLVVDHDMRLIMDISDEVVVLDQGKKIAEGTPLEVQNDKAVVLAYLGEEL